MSSGHVNPSNSSLSGPHYSEFAADPSALRYPVVPKPRRDGTMGQGRPCEICLKVIGLGQKGSLHSYNVHVEACRRKSLKPTSSTSDWARSLPVAPSTAATSSRSHRSVSLSPLIVEDHLHASLSPSPSPAHSPTTPITSFFFDAASDGDTRPTPASVQTTPAPLFIESNPSIFISPPSDDLPSSTAALHSPQSHLAEFVPCTGVSVQWTPGTIWETYPFPSHSFVKHPWDIIEFHPPSHLRLRSKACTGATSAGGYGSICHQCLWIPQCDAYKTIEKRANSAPPHTPHHLLAFHQLSGIPKMLRKMLNEARLKVIKITGI